MSQPTNTTPLFRNSLREWRASYKARQALAAEAGMASASTIVPRDRTLRPRKKRDSQTEATAQS
jgi:hypothetical protein